MPITLNGTTGVVTPGATVGSITGILKASSGVVAQAVAGTDYLVGGGSAIPSTNTAKAWVNFNGTTSPGTIRSSYNVSSITKNGTGDYTVNFATPMADANYSWAIGSASVGINGFVCQNMSSQTVNAIRFNLLYGASFVLADADRISLTIFGN